MDKLYILKKTDLIYNLKALDTESSKKNYIPSKGGKKAKKGRGVRVVGRLKQDTWKDNNGKTASRIYVVAEHIEYKPMKKTETSEEKPEAKTNESSPAAEGAPAVEASSETKTEGTCEVPVAEKVPVEEAVF